MGNNSNRHKVTHHKHNQFVLISLILLVFVCQTSLTPLPHSSVSNSLSDEAQKGKLSETQKGQERHDELSNSSMIQSMFLCLPFAQIITALRLFMLTLRIFIFCNIPPVTYPLYKFSNSTFASIFCHFHSFTLVYIFQYQVSTNRGELGMDNLYKTESIISLCMHNVGLGVPQASLSTFLSFLYLFLLVP